ncbi:MAG: diguanylate cyclase [Rubrivivax sp.]|nr:diguanylate cyclase [Rubrivivax sp.]
MSHSTLHTSTVFSADAQRLVDELDAAVEAHLGWTRRVLRCAVLHTHPGDDVLAADAHRRCRFGSWFLAQQDDFAALDAAATARVCEQHERMHDAVRALCAALLAGRRGEPADLDTFEATQSSLVNGLAQLKTRLLAHSARHDPLTGLPLRYGLEDEYGRHLALAARGGHRLALMLADVDHFKRVNDRHGHAVGDQALRHIAGVLRGTARAAEPVFRFGGEEFLLLLHARDAGAAAQAAERVLRALRDAPLQLADGTRLDLRISAGLSLAGDDETMAVAVERADRALYAAKQAGRDRWCWGEAGAPAP